MPDQGPTPIAWDKPVYIPIELAAELTGKSIQMVRRYARKGIVDSITDPGDRRRTLISVEQLGRMSVQPTRGRRLKEVTITRSDGSTITKLLPVLIKAGG